MRRLLRVYSEFAANSWKISMAYSIWFWVELAGQLLSMIVLFYFWRGVYANTATVSGLAAEPTLNYILLAQVVAPLVRWSLILDFGRYVREGSVAIELLRPVDFQARWYVEWTASMVLTVIRQALPLAFVAGLFFGIRLPADVRVWGAFVVSLLLGNAVLFFFDWIWGSLAFYLTEVWGLHILREGIATFFSGAFLPLAMLPGWLQAVASALPFGQALYLPVALLSGLEPVSRAPQIWAGQLAWLVGLWALSRIVFRVAARKVTVQGG